MTRWEVRIPFRDRDDPITDVAIDAEDFKDPEERRVVRELVHQAVLGGASTEQAVDENREHLAIILRHLGANAETYDELVQVARDLLADPEFIRLRDAIARALRGCPELQAADIEALARIYKPDQEETPCSI